MNTSIFDPEEISLTKYNIVLCHLYNTEMHGPIDQFYSSHHLVDTRFKYLDIDTIDEIADDISNYYLHLCMIQSKKIKHTLIQNYKNIIQREDYIKPEIAECIYLNTMECICILKTFWIKIIQRKWRNILKERKKRICIRCHPNSLKYREYYGYWPDNCNHLPVLRGMLSNI